MGRTQRYASCASYVWGLSSGTVGFVGARLPSHAVVTSEKPEIELFALDKGNGLICCWPRERGLLSLAHLNG